MRKIGDQMKTYKIIVEYFRDGEMYYDIHFQTVKSEQTAIDNVKEQWYALNDHVFPAPKDAQFFIKVD